MTNNKSKNQHKAVRKRKVFYVPGFDPISPRRYRELYRKEGAQQAAISGYDLRVKGRAQNDGAYGWDVNCKTSTSETFADIDVLVWSDIVRMTTDASIPSTYLTLLKTVWVYMSSGAFFRLIKLRRGPAIAAIYPVFILLTQLLIALFFAISFNLVFVTLGYHIVGVFAGVTGFYYVLYRFRKLDGKIYAYYLMQDFGFSAKRYGENPPELEERINYFSSIICASLDEDYDEVLVVGHSSGAHLAINIVSDVLRKTKSKNKDKLALLSLGQVVPMVSFLPKADRLRADLHYLSQQPDITWVDFSAPTDSCNFALCDPVTVSGVAPDENKKLWPLVLSSRFKETIDSERLEELKNQYFKLHIQYLCHFEHPLLYDYFLITAGDITLGERFENEIPSAARIFAPKSGFTSMDV